MLEAASRARPLPAHRRGHISIGSGQPPDFFYGQALGQACMLLQFLLEERLLYLIQRPSKVD